MISQTCPVQAVKKGLESSRYLLGIPPGDLEMMIVSPLGSFLRPARATAAKMNRVASLVLKDFAIFVFKLVQLGYPLPLFLS